MVHFVGSRTKLAIGDKVWQAMATTSKIRSVWVAPESQRPGTRLGWAAWEQAKLWHLARRMFQRVVAEGRLAILSGYKSKSKHCHADMTCAIRMVGEFVETEYQQLNNAMLCKLCCLCSVIDNAASSLRASKTLLPVATKALKCFVSHDVPTQCSSHNANSNNA